jgi:hypothetical protein
MLWNVGRFAAPIVALAASCGQGTETPTNDPPAGEDTLPLVDSDGVPRFLMTAWHLPLRRDFGFVYDFFANARAPDRTVEVVSWRGIGDAWQVDSATRFPYTADLDGAAIDGPEGPERWSFVATIATALHVSTSTVGTVVLFDCDSGALPVTVIMVTHGCSGF